jgi:aminoglycoside phosphotransferase (APT) family kinase protein
MTTPQWTADIDVDASLAAQLVRSQFPELRAERIERLGAGWDNEAFLAGGRVVFRFPRRQFSRDLIAREIAILPRIAGQLPLAISAPRFIGTPTAQYPYVFAGYEHIAGTTACSFPLTGAGRTALAEPLAAFLRALHAIDPAPFAGHDLSPDHLGRLDHEKRLPQTRERVPVIVAAGICDDLIPCVEWLAHNPPGAVADAQRRIVHGDLYARHVVLDPHGRAAGVIDWGDVHFGDPALDLAIAHLLLPREAHAAFRTRYGPVDDRTWNAARYRAIYHAVLELEYGLRIHDEALQSAGSAALRLIRPALTL